jgi:deferrochelatase/peroxidase EfeB
MEVDFRGVQAAVVHVYKRRISRHLIFRFGDRDGARAFVGGLTPRVAMADVRVDATADPLVTFGITVDGLRALGVEEALLAEFDAVYKAGPDAVALGDVPGSRSDPTNWWEGQFTTAEVHGIVHLYVDTDEAADRATAEIRDLAARGGVTELLPRRDGTLLEGRSLGGAKLHFGYTDGISHPDICWDDVPDTPTQVNFRTFLLGYSTPEFSSAPRRGPAADLVRDSTYGAFRWIYQDVAAFNRFLGREAPQLFPDRAPADAEELLAAKLLGRWRDGTPLVLSPEGPQSALASENDFGYAVADPDGRRCPFSAHIRVVNPRDQQLDPVTDGVPRVIRRGMPYGPPLTGLEDDGQDRGILGIFLGADLRRQIYTLTAWMNRNDFSPVYNGNRRTQDAVTGNRAVPGASRDFRLPREGGDAVVRGLPDFIHTKGTAFLLYPGKRTLEALAS